MRLWNIIIVIILFLAILLNIGRLHSTFFFDQDKVKKLLTQKLIEMKQAQGINITIDKDLSISAQKCAERQRGTGNHCLDTLPDNCGEVLDYGFEPGLVTEEEFAQHIWESWLGSPKHYEILSDIEAKRAGVGVKCYSDPLQGTLCYAVIRVCRG